MLDVSAWPSVTLGDLCTVVRGGSPRPAGDPRFFGGSFIPWLTVAAITNVSSSKLVITETVGHLTEAGSRRSRRFRPGTVVIANSGWKCGVAKILGFECCGNDGVAGLENLAGADPRFITYWINSQTEQLRARSAAGNEQPNLNTDRIAGLEVPCPPLEEQEAIAEALSDADALIEGLERLIAKKRLIKQGAMQELLTGKRRLPGFSGEWEVRKLGERGQFFKGSGVRKDDANSGLLPCVRYGELYTLHDDVVRNFASFISVEVAKTARPIMAGDILFAGSGETKEEIGKCAVVVYDGDMYAGGDIIAFRPTNDDPVFLSYVLNSSTVQKQKARKGQGDAVVHISATALGDLDLRLPGRDEQSKISAVLEDMDAEIQAFNIRLDKARQVKEGMMQNLLTGRIRLV